MTYALSLITVYGKANFKDMAKTPLTQIIKNPVTPMWVIATLGAGIAAAAIHDICFSGKGIKKDDKLKAEWKTEAEIELADYRKAVEAWRNNGESYNLRPNRPYGWDY